MDPILSAIAMYLMFVFSTTCHEAAHAFVARRGGDETAYSLGHVTLDPIPHIVRSPMGMVVAPMLGLYLWNFPLGWASVPYDPIWGQRHPRRRAFMSLAGPMANFLLAFSAIVALRVLIEMGVFHLHSAGVRSGFVMLSEGVAQNSPIAAVAFVLSRLFELNLMLGLFNLVPLPPLDGASVAEGLAPRAIGSLYDRLREIPAHELLGWIAATQLFRFMGDPMYQIVVFALGF